MWIRLWVRRWWLTVKDLPHPYSSHLPMDDISLSFTMLIYYWAFYDLLYRKCKFWQSIHTEGRCNCPSRESIHATIFCVYIQSNNTVGNIQFITSLTNLQKWQATIIKFQLELRKNSLEWFFPSVSPDVLPEVWQGGKDTHASILAAVERIPIMESLVGT